MSFTKHLLIALAAIVVLSTGAVASAQTTTTTGTADVTTQATTPGTPNTGAGGNAAANWFLLGVAGVAAVAGAGYLMRKPQADVK